MIPRARIPAALLLTALLAMTAGCNRYTLKNVRPPMVPPESFRLRGEFLLDYYTVQQAAGRGEAHNGTMQPIRDAAGNVLATLSPAETHLLARDHNLRLPDGRLLNKFRDANGRWRFRVLENEHTGIGADAYRLIPYRSLAVDPHRILPGSVVFIPAAYGIVLPNGEIHDGFFLAHDAHEGLAGNRLRLFTGENTGRKNRFEQAGLAPGRAVQVYAVAEPWLSAVKKRFEKQFTWHPQKPLYRMVAAEIDTLIRQVNRTMPGVRDRIAFYSERGKGTPYMIFLLGEGPHAKYDRDPLADFSRVDCMTFCEQILALSISESYQHMFDNLQKIRYKAGKVGFTSRNHYTIADWLPNNGWLLEDVSAAVGGGFAEKTTRIIDRRKFFLSNGVAEAELPPSAAAPETLTVSYVPAAHLSAIKNRLRGGEIVSIVTNMEGIISAHMGIIIRDAFGNVLFRHGSSSKRYRQVVDEYLDDVAVSLQHSKTRLGMMFMRVREDFAIPGVTDAAAPVPAHARNLTKGW